MLCQGFGLNVWEALCNISIASLWIENIMFWNFSV